MRVLDTYIISDKAKHASTAMTSRNDAELALKVAREGTRVLFVYNMEELIDITKKVVLKTHDTDRQYAEAVIEALFGTKEQNP